MRNSTLALILLALFALNGFPSFPPQFIQRYWRGFTPQPTPTATPAPLPAPPPRADGRTNARRDDHFARYAAATRELLYRNNFEALEARAGAARAGKERFPGGAWKLNAFYTGAGETASGAGSDADWLRHLGRLRQWRARLPNSITARVALGEALIHYGWEARGEGYIGTVTPQGRRLFRERLAQAVTVLNEGGARERCPHWYVSMLRVAKGQGWEQGRFDALFEEAAAAEPTYYYYHRVRAMYALPRWHGAPGEWERVTRESADRLGGKEGDILYYMVASHIYSLAREDFVTAESPVSWGRMKKGFAHIEATYGFDIERLNEACRIAGGSGDYATAHEMFERIGDDWSPEVWGTKEEFERRRARASSVVNRKS